MAKALSVGAGFALTRAGPAAVELQSACLGHLAWGPGRVQRTGPPSKRLAAFSGERDCINTVASRGEATQQTGGGVCRLYDSAVSSAAKSPVPGEGIKRIS